MKIIVCIKQVISRDHVKIDPETRRPVRSGEFSRLNPLDVFALAMALRLREEHGGSIAVLTMGPEMSEEVLWEALSMGVDRAVLLSDPRFAGSDTLATSYVLGMGVRKIGEVDVILSGLRTADSGTAQVGPQLAEELGIPHLTGVEKMEKKKGRFRIERISDGFREIVEVPPPALLMVASKIGVSSPNLIRIEDTYARCAIERWNLEDLNGDPARVGPGGSHTWVETLAPAAKSKSCVFVEGDPRQQAKSLFTKLLERNLLS